MPDNLLIRKKKKKEIKSLLQFLPEKLHQISTVEHIEFKDKKLKSAYLIDLVHTLMLKYFFKKDNYFTLSSTVLKSNYGKWYNYYIDFLISIEVIYLVKNYSVGIKSRIFSLSQDILNAKISRYKNKDKILLKKKEKKQSLNDQNKINAILKLQLINHLSRASIDYEAAIFLISSIVSDKDTYNRNLYAIDCINNGFIFWHFDDYGRFHTNFTILKSLIRKNCLLLDDIEVNEVDIPNSQPLFLLKLLETTNIRCKPAEVEKFKELVLNGRLYEFLRSQLGTESREETKTMVYHVLFGPNKRSKADSLFKKCFPSIHNFIVEFKRVNGDYRHLSYALQAAESEFIYNKVLVDFTQKYPSAPFLTVHDSIIIQRDYYTQCREIFDYHFDDYFRS